MEPIHYSLKLTKKERLIYIFVFEIISILICHFFYDNIVLLIPIQILLKWYIPFVKRRSAKLRLLQIRSEFIDFISALSSSLNTGYSLENSINESVHTMLTLHGENSIMYNEALIMSRKLLFNIPVEDLFTNLGDRTRIDEIVMFAEILKIAKKSGGNIISIINDTVVSIRNKTEIKEEIETSVASMKFEQMIMMCIPFAIFVYVDIIIPDFFAPLYHNIIGVIVSTICLLLYVSSILLAYRILNTED